MRLTENSFPYFDIIQKPVVNQLTSVHKKDHYYRTKYVVQKRNKYFVIKTKDIAYFTFEDDIVFITTFNKNRYAIDKSLAEIVRQLNPSEFFRINRQTIINIEAFDYYESHFSYKILLHFKDNLLTPILTSRSKAVQFKKWLDE